MQFSAVALVLGLAVSNAAAHSVFTTLFVDDVNQGDGTCVRMNMNPDTTTSPINDLSSNDMACGVDGGVGVMRVCSATQGSQLTFLWRTWADGSQPGSIDISHKGPCAVYMKAVHSAISDPGNGPGWFKIWDSGYDSTSSQWCTEKLIKNNGLFSVKIPSDLAGGYYLVRPELLALHQADKIPSNPQFYTGCAQIFLQTSGTAIPSGTVSIPGHVHAGDASVTFNIYTPVWPYTLPGPAPYQSNNHIVNTGSRITVSAQVQTEGVQPEDCVLSNANWCGIELDSYSTESGCWNASTNCFNQATTCYSTSPPTGSKGCKLWEARCAEIQAACKAGNFNGPPNKGKNLNPVLLTGFPIPLPEPQASGLYSFTYPATAAASMVTDTYLQSPTSVTVELSSSAESSTPTLTTTQSTTSTHSPSSTPSDVTISRDATCGAILNITCLGSPFGACCSKYGWCGVTDAYCGEGCQEGFGICGQENVKEVSEDMGTGEEGNSHSGGKHYRHLRSHVVRR